MAVGENIGWAPDVLDGFEQVTLPLAADDEGEVVATLVRRIGVSRGIGVDILYVHGWVDYFHQAHLADFFENLGWTFYALDLRKYGRSLRDWQTPGYIATLKTYNEDIEAALKAMGHGAEQETDRTLVLMGHSTGGLIVTLWAAYHPGRVDALMLNSPWLEFQTGPIGRKALEGPIKAQALLAPMSPLVNIDPGFYLRSVSNRFEGEWPVIPQWRPDEGWRPRAAWLAAIFRAHERVQQGLDLDIPVLVLLSAKSAVPLRWKPELMSADQVLAVAEVANRSPFLGQTVTTVRLNGALHDVVLSSAQVRTKVWFEMTRWIKAYVPVPIPPMVPPIAPPPAKEDKRKPWRPFNNFR